VDDNGSIQVFVRPHLEYCSPVRNLLVGVQLQSGATKLINRKKTFQLLAIEHGLKHLGLLRLELFRWSHCML